jgi:hypothetical protein
VSLCCASVIVSGTGVVRRWIERFVASVGGGSQATVQTRRSPSSSQRIGPSNDMAKASDVLDSGPHSLIRIRVNRDLSRLCDLTASDRSNLLPKQ